VKYTQAIFGFNVSGGGLPSIFTIEFEQPNLINGGDFGFEGVDNIYHKRPIVE
jgi:hypothetical protein